eukprot:560352-Amphidinium_carterae.1
MEGMDFGSAADCCGMALYGKYCSTSATDKALFETSDQLGLVRHDYNALVASSNSIERVAEYESRVAHEVVHEGRHFFSYVEQQAREFSREEEANTECNMFDHEFKLYRRADARRQQEQFSDLQRRLKSAHAEEMVRHRRTLKERYQHEFRTEVDSVQRELNIFQEASAETTEAAEQVRTLRDELLCVQQRNSLSEQRLRAELGQFADEAQRHEATNYQLELQVEQVTSMNQTTISELQQELINLEAPIVTPGTGQIDTPDFGAVSIGAAIPLSSINARFAGSLNWLALRSRPDIAWAVSRAA